MMAATTGTIGITMFYGTAMMNLIWQHIGWAKIDKGDLDVIGKVNVVFPLISHFALSFIPVLFLVYFFDISISFVICQLHDTVLNKNDP